MPPVGTPNFFLALLGSGYLGMWKYHVDFQNPTIPTFIGPTYISVAPYNTTLCADFSNGACIPQPETAQRLSGLNDRLMNRLAYRNFGDHESLVVDHTVVSDSGTAGIRWYEIRNPNGTPTVYQQSTYAIADNNYRWLGSIAQDHDGNIAMGLSVSGFYPVYPWSLTRRLASVSS